jgi:hypothetical protein
MDCASIFERDRYVILPALLRDPTLAQAYQYACLMASSGKMRTDDDQVSGTPSAYGDFIMDGLLDGLLPDIERACGEALFPTYSYFRVYKRSDVLREHTDRPSCEISVTLCLGFEGEKPWPIWIKGPNGVFSASLRRGEALLYRGIECPHWRDAFEGSRQAQVFLHYVCQNGPHAEWKFDKRSSPTRLRSILAK